MNTSHFTQIMVGQDDVVLLSFKLRSGNIIVNTGHLWPHKVLACCLCVIIILLIIKAFCNIYTNFLLKIVVILLPRVNNNRREDKTREPNDLQCELYAVHLYRVFSPFLYYELLSVLTKGTKVL